MFRVVVPLTLVLALSGCLNVEQPEFGKDDTGSPDETDADTDVDSDTDSDTDADTDTDTDADTDTSTDPGSAFDEAGDIVGYKDVEGVVAVDLTDASGDSNKGQEFYLVVVNTSSDELGYQLRYYDATGSFSLPPPPARSRPAPAPDPLPYKPRMPVAAPPPPPPLDAADIGTARDEFLVRRDLESTTDYATVSATLWAVGENVEIWVDDDVSIDWDQDCDGTVDVPGEFDAYGFDNCDLADVADIIDTNIIPNVRSLYGDESDINGDGRVSVVITPQLNAITETSDDEGDHLRVLSSYAEPAVDLAEWDYIENPGSDMQEVLYVFAPDPYGFFNPNTAPTVESFTGYQLAAEVARSFTSLVSYNQHYLLVGDDGAVEDEWVTDILGTFAAEYCGFGAAYHQDAWDYVDATHRYALASSGTPGSLATLSRGAPYLFGLWLYEQAEATEAGSGATLLAAIMQSGTTGSESIESAVAADGGSFAKLVLGWQVALVTSGVTTSDGAPLADPTEWAPYPAAETIVAPPASPGGFYGANGYQSGLNLRGDNRSYRGGTTDSPAELPEQLVRMENSDSYIYTPGFEFVGWMEGNYAAQVVRLTGITYDEALLRLQATDTGLVGAVIRWEDPVTADFTVENIFSTTDSNAIRLPTLGSDGAVVHAVGQITENDISTSVTDDGDTEVEVADTDRWLLDLTGRSTDENVTVAVWLDRHFATTSGTMGPDDPWIAVAPRELVPEPTVEGTLRGGTCPDGADFAYPTSLLEYLTAQVFLASTMQDGTEDDFDPCGDQAGTTTTCDLDWDRDGVLDSDEPQPETFLAQARVMECTLNGNVAVVGSEYGTDWLDIDELDEDELPTYDYLRNTGGSSGDEGEEAYAEVTLRGGREYLVIVGANGGDTGTYELSVRQVE